MPKIIIDIEEYNRLKSGVSRTKIDTEPQAGSMGYAWKKAQEDGGSSRDVRWDSFSEGWVYDGWTADH